MPHQLAEEARQRLKAGGWLRGELAVVRDEGAVIFPISANPNPAIGLGEIGEYEFATIRAATAGGYRERVHVPDDVRSRLPRAFDVVGDVVVIRIPDKLVAHSEAIGTALLETVPSARLVCRDSGVHGTDRRRDLVRIAGTGLPATVHHENGIALDVDLRAAYFSPRLAREHGRVAEAVRLGETVFDLCCGVGPFSALITRHARARRVVAVDNNPAAAQLARSNIARAGSATAFEVRCEDLEQFFVSCGPCDRAILNLPLQGIKYLTSVAATVAPGGTVHYYEVAPRGEVAARREAHRTEVASVTGDPWSAAEPRVVHPYSARDDLFAFTFSRALA